MPRSWLHRIKEETLSEVHLGWGYASASLCWVTRPCTGSQSLAPPSRRASSNHKGLRPAEGLPGSEVMIQGLDSQQCWQRHTVFLRVQNHITVHTSAPHLREMKLHRLIPEPAQQEVASTFQIGVVFWQRKHHTAATGQFAPMRRACLVCWNGLWLLASFISYDSSTVHSWGPWLFCTHLYGPSVRLHVHLEPKQADIRNLPKIHLFEQVPTSHW